MTRLTGHLLFLRFLSKASFFSMFRPLYRSLAIAIPRSCLVKGVLVIGGMH